MQNNYKSHFAGGSANLCKHFGKLAVSNKFHINPVTPPQEKWEHVPTERLGKIQVPLDV